MCSAVNASNVSNGTKNSNKKNEISSTAAESNKSNKKSENSSKKNEVKSNASSNNKGRDTADKNITPNKQGLEENENVNSDKESEKKTETVSILNLEAALGLALAKNEAIKVAKLKVGMAENNVNKGYSAFLPTISATGTYTYNAIKGTDEYNNGTMHYSTHRDEHSDNVSAKLVAGMNIFNFGRDYFSLMSSKSNRQISEYDLATSEKKLILNVLSYYYHFLSSLEKEKAMIEMLNLYKNTMDAAKLKYKLGIVPLVDKLTAENSYSESSLKSEEVKNNTKKMQVELSVLMGLEANAEFDVEKDGPKPKKLTFDIEDLKRTALLNRIDYKSLKETKKGLEYGLKALKASRYPSVDLNGSASTSANTTDKKFSDLKGDNFLNNYSASISVTIPIFSGFSVTNSIKAKEKEIKACEFEINSTRKTIEKEVVSAYYDFVINQEKFFITKDLLKTATENAKVMLGMYKNGKISILELLNAQAKLEEAKISFVESKYDWFIYRVKLLDSIGKLNLNNVININEF